ncbi:hypothetical protein KY347_06835 [Candidatus Woesearchaeota archaeon]|nr:hypothetical protein [Candidatus Woesearchaeota archaeon]
MSLEQIIVPPGQAVKVFSEKWHSILSITEIVEAILEEGPIEESTGQVPIGSITLCFYGGLNEDGRSRFKIRDYDFGLNMEGILEGYMNPNGSIQSTPENYRNLDAIECIIIKGQEVGAEADYAIPADHYYRYIRERLNSGKLSEKELIEHKGFLLNAPLTQEEILGNGGHYGLLLSIREFDFFEEEKEELERTYGLLERFVKRLGGELEFSVKADERGCVIRPFSIDPLHKISAIDGFDAVNLLLKRESSGYEGYIGVLAIAN